MSYLHKNLSLIDPNKYSSLIGKEIKITFNKQILDKTEISGTCLTTPPPFIICDIYREIFPTISVSVKNDDYTAHVSITNIENIYKICDDITSKKITALVCKRKKVSNDLSRYITSFMEGWTVDIPLY